MSAPTATATVAAIDLGATSGRVLTGTLTGGKLALTEYARFPNGPVELPHEHGTDLIWDLPFLFSQVTEGLRTAATASPLDAVGIDSWAVDYGLIDAGGRLLANPAAYRSNRTQQAVPTLLKALPASSLYQQNGLQLQPFNTIFQLLADREDQRSASAARLLLVPDLISYWLTGRRQCEVTNASTTGLIDPRTRGWDPALLRLLSDRFGVRVPAILPALVEPGTVTGEIKLRRLHPLTKHGAPTPLITVGSHDTASAVAAVPASVGDATAAANANAAAKPGFAYISAGTWSLVGVELTEPVLSDAAREANFTNELGVDGTVRFLKNVMGAWITEQCLAGWRTHEPQPGWDVLDAETAAAPPLRTLFDVDDPILAAPGDMAARIDQLAAAAGEPQPRNRGEYLRAITESLAFAHRRALAQAAQLSCTAIDRIHIVGGGSRNASLCQMTADATGIPVLAGPVEATAIGNMLITLRTIGALSGGLPELRGLVAASFTTKLYEPTPGASRIWESAARRVARQARH